MHLPQVLVGAAAVALVATSALAQPSPSTPAQAATPGAMPAMPGMASMPGMPGMPSSAMSPGAAGYRQVTPMPAMNIVAELTAAGQFTTLIKALAATNLTGVVSGTPNLTLFAPTDAAFAALPAGAVDALMKDPAKLQGILTYHLVATRVPLDAVQGHPAGPVTTAANKPVTVDGSTTPLKVGDASVLQAAIPASNGLIYVIDKVLMPTT